MDGMLMFCCFGLVPCMFTYVSMGISNWCIVVCCSMSGLAIPCLFNLYAKELVAHPNPDVDRQRSGAGQERNLATAYSTAAYEINILLLQEHKRFLANTYTAPQIST